MKRLFCLVLTAALALSLWACETPYQTVTTGSVPTTTATAPSVTIETEPIPTETEPPAPTEPEHAAYYLPEVSLEDMITYFNEVVLATEYATGDGDATLVQKWLLPIRYRIHGDPTEEDLVILEDLFAQLNAIEGFPGIHPATEDIPSADLDIRFLDLDAFNLEFSDFLQGEYSDGAVQYWYSDNNEIYTARIGYRTDISQDIRNSVLLEEVVNLLGITDTVMREDSIVYQYSSDTTVLSEIDWALIGLLYHPDIQCGMNAAQCREVLERIYC